MREAIAWVVLLVGIPGIIWLIRELWAESRRHAGWHPEQMPDLVWHFDAGPGNWIEFRPNAGSAG